MVQYDHILGGVDRVSLDSLFFRSFHGIQRIRSEFFCGVQQKGFFGKAMLKNIILSHKVFRYEIIAGQETGQTEGGHPSHHD